MRKFLALLLVIAMLAVTASAFATGVGHKTVNSDGSESQETSKTEVKKGDPVVKTETVTVVKLTMEAVTKIATTVSTTTVSSMVKEASAAATELVNETDIKLTDAQKTQLTNLTTNTKATLNKSGTLDRIAKMISSTITTTIEIVETTSIVMEARTESAAEQMDYAATLLASLALSSGKSKSSQVPIAMLPTMTPEKSGVAMIPMPLFKEENYGKKVRGNTFQKGRTYGASSVLAGSFGVAAADDAGDGVFLDSIGNETDTVPGTGGEAIPGYLTFATYMEAGEEYEPVISVSEEDVDASYLNPEEEEVEYTEIATEDFTFASGDAFDNDVPTRIISATGYSRIPGEKIQDYDFSPAEFGCFNSILLGAKEKSCDVARTLDLPAINGLTAGTYIVKVYFTKPGDSFTLDSSRNKFWAYMNGFENTESPETVNASANAAVSSVNVVRETSYGGKVENVSAYDVLSNVDTATYLVINTGEGDLKPSMAAVYDYSEGGNTDPVTAKGPGSSSGGCSAGWSGLGLLLLAGLVARKK